MTMEQFFSKCGSFIYSETLTKGESPQRTFIEVFNYFNGYSTYDGRKWHFVIFTASQN